MIMMKISTVMKFLIKNYDLIITAKCTTMVGYINIWLWWENRFRLRFYLLDNKCITLTEFLLIINFFIG